MVLESDQWSVKLYNGTNDLGDQERRAREQQIWREQEKIKINDSSGCNGDILKTKQVMTEIKRLMGSVWFLDLRKRNHKQYCQATATVQQEICKQTIEISVWTQERNSTNLNDFLSLVEHKRWYFEKYLKVFFVHTMKTNGDQNCLVTNSVQIIFHKRKKFIHLKVNTAICHPKLTLFTPDSVNIYIAHMSYALFI